MNNKIKLTNPTDDQLSAAVAEHVLHSTIKPHKPTQAEIESGSYFSWEPNYATSADAVLPLMGNNWMAITDRAGNVTVTYMPVPGKTYTGKASTFAKAGSVALLRANGIEVEVT